MITDSSEKDVSCSCSEVSGMTDGSVEGSAAASVGLGQMTSKSSSDCYRTSAGIVKDKPTLGSVLNKALYGARFIPE